MSIGLWADTNTKSLSRVDPKRQGVASAARKPLMHIFMERAAAASDPKGNPGVKPLKWTGTQYPTLASAQDAHTESGQGRDDEVRPHPGREVHDGLTCDGEGAPR